MKYLSTLYTYICIYNMYKHYKRIHHIITNGKTVFLLAYDFDWASVTNDVRVEIYR